MTRGTWLALGAMAISVFVIANDLTALSVALPDIEKDFDSDVTTVQWVINAYALVFGVLIVTGGRLADMLGRRRIFFIGAAIFAAFSVLGGAAQDELWLIACRALMGIGGAMMWPAVLGMTYEILPDDRAALAGGLIIGSAGFGNAAGPADRRAADRRAELALDPVRQPADRGAGLFRDLAQRGGEPRLGRRGGHRRARRGHPLDGPDRAAAGARPGDGLGLDRPAHPRPVRGVRRAARVLRRHRAARRSARAGARRRDGEPGLPRGLPGHSADVGHVLLGAALPAPVHAEDPRLGPARGRPRAAAADGRVRGDLVRRRAALRALRRQGRGHGGSDLPDRRHLPDLAGRRRLRAGASWCRG